MMRIFIFIFTLFIYFPFLQAQMWNGTDTLYGNEWIDYEKTYFKIMVAKDGIYRVPRSTLESAGIPVNTLEGTKYQLFHMGKEAPIYVSTNSILGANDYIEFYGEKNRAELDEYLYNAPDEELLNLEYSLFTDTSAYFLTWTTTEPTNRFQNIQNDLTNLPNKEDYFTHTEKAVFSSSNIKKSITNGIYYSNYVIGEGFAHSFTNSLEVSLAPKYIFTGVNESSLNIRLATSEGNHNLSINLNGSQQLFDQPNGFTLKQYDLEILTSALTGDDKVLINSDFDDYDKHAVANVILNYPRTFNFDGQSGFKFNIKASSSPLYLEIENFITGGDHPILYDLTNNIRIVTQNDGNIIKVKLPASTEERVLYLNNNASGSFQTSLQTANFVNYDQQEAQFIIISNKKLFNDGNGNNWVQEYANYRSSPQGGNYSSSIIEIQQLYDQFAYGINRHSIAIRNFAHYIKKGWTSPEFVFLIGKGREYLNIRTHDQLVQDVNETFYVPTFGRPGSDNLLFAGNNTSVPVIPVSRIAVSSPEEIKNYLDKVIALENNVNNPQTIEDKLWMKRILHLGGGSTNEQATIRNHLAVIENIIENNKFGGDVTSFYKNSGDPIQISDTDALFNLINDGVSIITFFGHSAVGSFDFNIDNPIRYENYGKYPLFLSLGCYSGNIHTFSQGVSERFVFRKDKGSIAFAASSGQGYISSLKLFAEEYYSLIGSEEYYGSGIGKLLQETIRHFDNQGSVGIKLLNQQFTMHGDPAVRLNPSEGPDFTVEASSIRFEPMNLTANLDSFTIKFAMTNLGYAISDSFNIEVKQELPNGSQELLFVDRIATPSFQDALSYKVASFKKDAAGQNKLFIKTDIADDIEELPDPSGELNNDLLGVNGSPGVPFYIFDDSARPVTPENYGIVTESNTVLKASTVNSLAPVGNYVLEIDTSQLFNSPIKERAELMQVGGVISWEPNIIMTDSTVYYWRISLDSLNPEAPYVWENSSFVYLPNSTKKGWNQSHYYQYNENVLETMYIDEQRKFNFSEKLTPFRVKNKVYNINDPPKGFVGSIPWSDFFRWDIPEAINIVVFHNSGNNWGNTVGHIWFNNNPGDHGSVNTTATQIACFPFPASTISERENIINFLTNVVPDDAYVFLYTALRSDTYTLSIDEWAADSISLGGVNLFNILESHGATDIRPMETSGAVPYLFAFKKGAGPIFEQRAANSNGEIDFETPIPSASSEGEFYSVQIGPAASWDKLFLDYTQIEPSDSVDITVYGIGTDDQKDSLNTFNLIGEHDLSFIDPTIYPYLDMRFKAKDESNQTPVQLKRWTVLYEGLPEAAVAPALTYEFNSDTLQQGADGLFELAIQNIGDYDMDSLLVKFSIIDQNNSEIAAYQRLAPLDKDDFLNAKFYFETKDLVGINNVILEVNPDGDQQELYHFNNYAVKQFFVDRDNKNPLLDVTFDGVHIMDGDIVSPTPNIYISLKDENPYLELSDTSLFKVFIKYPDAYVAENISFQNDWMTFFPASSTAPEGQNNAYIEFKPNFEKDGIYQLLVQAEDASGNQSGEVDYKVNFEVITKQMISNVLNYPNPFSTSTQFVYTLTGSEIPEYFKIQIMTISGKIVKEITQDEIGPLKIGTHRTEYRWDGTDTYGARLANGVYLYRVVVKKSNFEDYESYNTGTNDLFKKGFGKLVIMR